MSRVKMPHIHELVRVAKRKHGISYTWIAQQMGITRQDLSSWWGKGRTNMPAPLLLFKLSVAIQTPYLDVLEAALTDFSYRPESAAASSEPSAQMKRFRPVVVSDAEVPRGD